jgi:hypothetical protein
MGATMVVATKKMKGETKKMKGETKGARMAAMRRGILQKAAKTAGHAPGTALCPSEQAVPRPAVRARGSSRTGMTAGGAL